EGFFVDVTGSQERIVNKALNILVTSLAELDRSVEIEQVRIRYTDGERVTPDLTPQHVVLDPAHTARTIGVSLSPQDVMLHLQQMGHTTELTEAKGAPMIEVAVPAYRNDIMHPIDLVEDVAIAYGYHNLATSLVPTMTVGEPQQLEETSNLCRRCMCGLGHHEVITLLLSSEEQQYDALRLARRDEHVQIENPISVEQTMVRTVLLPGLLETFGVNTDHEMPQQIFEVGNITRLDSDAETGAREVCHVAGGATGPRVDYSTIRSACEALLFELGYGLEVEASESASFIPGRGAEIYACRGEDRFEVGAMGELHPEVLERFKLVQPTAAFEIDLAALLMR
ncbi:MAG: hypothetical protein JRH20_07615, partial [Deltaproteobacteria bacterium]|nr:hypothetical protein [Deltaproteobacteria bacterium]